MALTTEEQNKGEVHNEKRKKEERGTGCQR